jgi:hypothetical protein
MKITIPESQHEITVEQWIKLEAIVKDENTEELLKKFQVVATLCNCDLGDLLTANPKEVLSIYLQLSEIVNAKHELVKHFTIDGIKYGFIPNLDNISTAEYLDLNNYFGKDNIRTLAVLYRPIKSESKNLYAIEDYKGTDKLVEVMKKAPASALTSSQVFFYNLGKDLLIHTTEYLVKNLTEQEQADLSKNGDGISQLMQLPTMIEQSIMKL